MSTSKPSSEPDGERDQQPTGSGGPEERPTTANLRPPLIDDRPTCYRCGQTLLINPNLCPACGATQSTVCRGCGTLYRKADGRCPVCGMKRVRRRRKPSRLKMLRNGAVEFARAHKRHFAYIAAGMAVGALSRGVLIELASYSMPPGWLAARGQEPFTLKHFLDPFIGAGITLGTWALLGLKMPFAFAWSQIRAHPSAVTLGIIGSLLGLLAACASERRRQRHK